MKAISPYDTPTGNKIYLHRESGIELLRVVGAFAWPCYPNPGGIVVVGEEWRLDPRFGRRKFYVFAEREKETIADLHRVCRELTVSHCVDEYLTDTTDRGAMHHFDKLDDEMDCLTLLFQAPYSEHNPRLSEYYQLFNELLHEDHTSLFFGEESAIVSYIKLLPPEDTQKRAKEYPLLAALGYALGQLLIEETPKDMYYYPEPQELGPSGKSVVGGY